MKHVCIFIWFALMFPICIVAQDKPLDLQIQYNKETKNLVFTVTNKAKAEIYFMNDRGNKQDSLFWLKRVLFATSNTRNFRIGKIFL